MPTVAACQTTVDAGAVNANAARVEERLAALPDGVDVAVFPETVLTGGARNGTAIADDHVAIDRVREAGIAAGCHVVVGFVERDGDERYNSTAYLDEDGIRARYRKRHPWDDEGLVVEPGTEPGTVETPVGTAGMLACHDLNYVADSAELAREEITALFVVGAWPATHDWNWNLLTRARALDGVRWVVAANRTGEDHAGGSGVIRPDGRVATAVGRGERDVIAELDPAVLAEQRELIGIYD